MIHSCRILPGKKEVGLLALLFACGVPVHAEAEGSSFTLDQTVVTATLSEASLDEVPAAVEVITADKIDEMGAETLHQVLSEAQSIMLEQTSGRQSVVRMRGLGAGSVLVLLDGVRLPSGFQDKVDLVEIPAGLIERIEIVRGSGSALYGSDAIAGVINVITKKPSGKTKTWFGSRYGQNSDGEAQESSFDAGVSGSSGSVGYVLAGSFVDKGRYDFDIDDNKTDGDDMRISSGAARILWQAGEHTTVGVGAIYAEVEREGLRPKKNRLNDWDNHSKRFTTNVQVQHELSKRSSLLFRWSHSEYNWAQSLLARDLSYSESHEVDQVSDQYEARWRGNVSDSQVVTAGLEYRTEERHDDGVKSDTENFALFVQDELSLSERFRAVLGLRLDDHSGFGSVLSPKVNLSYGLSDMLRLRAAFGLGFRAPSAFELYSGSPYTINRVLLPNPDLDPETSQTWEAGIDLVGRGWSLNLTAFRNDVKDMIAEVFTGDYDGKVPVNLMDNIADAMTRGLELSFRLELPGGFELSDELSWLDSEDKFTGDELLYVPDLSNVLELAWRNKPAGFRGSVRLVSSGSTTYSTGLTRPGYSIVNLQASKNLTSQVRVSAGVDNLFDKKVEDAYGNVYGPGSSGTVYYCGLRLDI